MTDIPYGGPFPELAQVGLRAVSAPPATEWSEEPDFDLEAGRFGTLTPPNWVRLLQVATALAAKKCDLRLYNYLCLAAFNAKDLSGQRYAALAAALAGYHTLVTQGWQRCVQHEDRADHFEFLSEHLGAFIDYMPPAKGDRADFLACRAEVLRFATAAGAALGLDRPVLRELREVLERHAAQFEPAAEQVQQKAVPSQAEAPPPQPVAQAESPPPKPVIQAEAPPPKPVVKAEAPPPQPVAQAETPPPHPVAQPVAQPGAQTEASQPRQEERPAETADAAKLRLKLEQEARDAVLRYAENLRNEALADPAPYLMVRAFLWSNQRLLRADRYQAVLQDKARAVTKDTARRYRTTIPAPAGHLAQKIQTGLKSGRHAEVIKECEELLARYPLWLDLQRWVATSLEALKASEARRVVTLETGALLERFPALTEFLFEGDVPLAGDETVSWLSSLRGASVVTVSVPPPRDTVDAEDPAALPPGLIEGLAALRDRLAHTQARQRQYRIRLHMAEHCLAHGRADLAEPVLGALSAEADEYHLERWDPVLLERTLHLQVQSARMLRRAAELRTALFGRLCQLDPGQAARLGVETP